MMIRWEGGSSRWHLAARKPSSSTWPLPGRGWMDLQSRLRDRNSSGETKSWFLSEAGLCCPTGCLAPKTLIVYLTTECPPADSCSFAILTIFGGIQRAELSRTGVDFFSNICKANSHMLPKKYDPMWSFGQIVSVRPPYYQSYEASTMFTIYHWLIHWLIQYDIQQAIVCVYRNRKPFPNKSFRKKSGKF